MHDFIDLANAIREITPQVREWSKKNFPGNEMISPLFGIYEEVGEFFHSTLKKRQGIRGTTAEHVAGQVDALCDACIYAMDYIGATDDEYGKPVYLSSVVSSFASEHRELGPVVYNYKAPADPVVAKAGEEKDAFALAMVAAEITDGVRLAYDDQHPDAGETLVSGLVGAFVTSYVFCRRHLGVDFVTALRETWAKVKTRDWRANPVAAHAVAEAAVAAS